MNRTITAVLDRIVDGQTAVLLLEGEGERGENETADEREEDETDTQRDDAGEREAKASVDRTSTNANRPVDQLDVDVETLPEVGRHEGAVFDVDLENGALVDATYRPEETRDRRERAQDRFDRLSERLSDRDEE
ncbi:DUF3006 domain-containing protein [Halobacteria archaeon AArc-m2/3/4]|uniref:DUF3006 domain-containing protein n=1 Tax=Natronoglomus mannanivorans TaxID=2979990 RepID=A0AAP2YX95_9EURY|nr:DUF3006 domain-containing protein [Halobacteria archaeon AArc-xg1-1]MCU4971334.1 DUF3006 domain-containing protein [Halobacteria archaeon AArc-m2/3/4]